MAAMLRKKSPPVSTPEPVVGVAAEVAEIAPEPPAPLPDSPAPLPDPPAVAPLATTPPPAKYPHKLPDGDVQLTEHFKLSEFACHDGTPVPAELVGNVTLLAQDLEILRAALGGKPMTIVSGYRHPAYNKQVGGALDSTHITCLGADVKVLGCTPDEVFQTACRLKHEGKITQGGVGVYVGWAHVDRRGYKARWDNRSTGDKRG